MKKHIVVDDRMLVFGGVYGNLQALEALLKIADDQGFEDEQILCTGDLVAYCGQPSETVELIRSRNFHLIQGNCEESLSLGVNDCGCGFEEGSACDLLSVQWFNFCQEALSQEQKAWMGSLPTQLEISFSGKRFLCCHGTPESINEFVFPSHLENPIFIEQHGAGFDGIIAGHSGIPFIAGDKRTFWFNSGALGMPANDGTPRGWYGIIEANDSAINIRTAPLEYDNTSAAAAMRAVGLNNGYADALVSGLWPSLDVLPEEEKTNTGHALSAQDYTMITN